VRDASILRVAKKVAGELYRKDKGLSALEHEEIRRFLERRGSAAAGAD
jgi:hypothetical protein